MTGERETALETRIKALIAREGPISIARYVGLCLGDPDHGYYMTRAPIGAGGDFITAPEISQMFGELIGLWCVDTWTKMGAPEALVLAELGPGRGTLMADAMRAARIVPDFATAARLHLVETSPVLRECQGETLTALGLEPFWHGHVGTLPDGPAIVIANEFFDALPVRQFERTGRGWRERGVILSPEGRLAIGYLDAPPAPDEIPDAYADAAVDSVIELSAAGTDMIGSLAARFAASPGALLAIDYGHDRPGTGDTLQAVTAHAYAPVFERPGEVDLTAHVDFAALAAAARARGAAVFGPMPQGAFLRSLGMAERAERLSRSAAPAQVRDIEAALQRLTGDSMAGRDGAMGTLFKVMAVASADLPTLEPFGMG